SHNFFSSLAPKQFSRAVTGVKNAVAEEHEHLSGLGAEGEFVVFSVVEQAERQSSGLDDFYFAVVAVHGTRQSGVGHLQRPVLVIPHGIDKRDELPVNAALSQGKVHRAQHLCGMRLNGRMRTQNSADQRGVNCRRCAFTADIANHQPETRKRVIDKVIEIAADRTCRSKARRQFEVVELRQSLRKQAELKFARQRQVAFQAFFLTSDLLVQTRILDRNRNLCCQGGYRTHVVVGKKSAPGVLEVKHAKDLVFVDQWDRKLRAGFRIQRDIAGILADVRHKYRFFVLNCIADHAIASRDVVLQMNIFVEAHGEPVLQLLAGCVQQQDAEHLVVNNAGQQLGNALEKFVKVEDGAEFSRNFIQQDKRTGLPGSAGIKAGILNADRHA